MSRIVSIWLRAWPIARLLRSQAASVAPDDPVDASRPMVLVAPGKGGPRVTALNRAAHEGGIASGELLSNARAKVLGLQVRDWDTDADAEALARLATWALRYSPAVAFYDAESGADGLLLEITGCAHLFGGERALLDDMRMRLKAAGLAPRLAIADTVGAAWALSHHAPCGTIASPMRHAEMLQGLPLAALRLGPGALSLLQRLGLKRVGEIMGQPRAPFAARFEAELLGRLDQALGRTPEPLVTVTPPPRYHAQASFMDPIFSEEHVLVAADRLLQDVSAQMLRDGAGARMLRLLLFRVEASNGKASLDHGVTALDIGLATPSREPAHILRLIALKLERLGARALTSEFGFEAAALHVRVAEPLHAHQANLRLDQRERDPHAVSDLVDRLRQRLGGRAVRALRPRQSHLPELAEEAVVPAPGLQPDTGDTWRNDFPVGPRPSLLLPEPEAADVIALIPDGPPRQFRWRGVLHHVAHASGPERITPEWWRRKGERTRDYYLVEDVAGRRFWLYRAGLFEPDAPAPTWYVHAVFG